MSAHSIKTSSRSMREATGAAPRTMQRVEPLCSACSVDSAACSRASVSESGSTSSARGSASAGAAAASMSPVDAAPPLLLLFVG